MCVTVAHGLRPGHFSLTHLFFKKVVSILKYYVSPNISTKLFIIAFSSLFNQSSGGSIARFLPYYYNNYPKLCKMV